MADKRPAHMVRIYDELLFGRVRVRAAEEGRTVGAVVENALKLYLTVDEGARERRQAYERDFQGPREPEPPTMKAAEPRHPTMDELRRSIEGLQRPAVHTVAEREILQHGRPKTAREAMEQAAARQEWLRTHPEEEGQ